MTENYIHFFTVRGRPAALDKRGAIHAVELGYFPISSTGYWSASLWLNKAPELTEELFGSIQKDLEKKAKERDKEIADAEKSGIKALGTKHTDPVHACIDLSGAFDRVAGQALFLDEDDQGDLLHLALRLADKLATMSCPETLDHHAWKVEHIQKQIDKASIQVELVRQALSDGHMLAIAESPDCALGGGGAYAMLFRKQNVAGLPTEGAEPARCVIDRRRIGKAFLIGRDKYYIWCGHYTHDPDLSAWGMTEQIDDAYRFTNIQECLEYWRSRHNFPEEYEHCIWDGYLTFFEESKKGIRRVMPEPIQGELFT
jgi:hypothetical protein